MSNLKIEIPSEDLGWIVSLLNRGLMEHQTSYGNSIPVPKEVVEFIKNLSDESTKYE